LIVIDAAVVSIFPETSIPQEQRSDNRRRGA
jgi:hypothetical protein